MTAPPSLRLLILGGTRFAGRHVAAAALDAGHEVTLFNRGFTAPELFPSAEKLRGDRDGDLSALAGRRWDAVIDCCGYRPEQVRASARLLAGAVQRYVFISTVSVYADFAAGPGEDSPLEPPEAAAARLDRRYGAAKALCEHEAEAAMPGRVLHVRPGLLIGPHDRMQRFAYWVRRVAAGGEVLAPGRQEHPLQLIDARDLASWLMGALARGDTGRFNATSPRGRLTFGDLLETCRLVAASEARFTWVSEEFLVARGVRPFDDLPLWVPAELAGFHAVDTSRAMAAGLTLRPLAHSVRAVLASGAAAAAPASGAAARLTPQRESELLAAWHEGKDRAVH
ncbi:MAG TPA: NAD-dependent epimerase/dehydratase family protein [Thermoanaerobaculia bacterium]|jgi:2'-hydroxyisoflavone reductase|nr:NAD-dependent epimerase/dehydratase family protein [Thermoanaerobaculia bacterium]